MVELGYIRFYKFRYFFFIALPLCNNTENTTVNPTTVSKVPTDRDATKMGQSDSAHNSAIGIYLSLHLVELISLTLQMWYFNLDYGYCFIINHTCAFFYSLLICYFY